MFGSQPPYPGRANSGFVQENQYDDAESWSFVMVPSAIPRASRHLAPTPKTGKQNKTCHQQNKKSHQDLQRSLVSLFQWYLFLHQIIFLSLVRNSSQSDDLTSGPRNECRLLLILRILSWVAVSHVYHSKNGSINDV